MAIFMFSLAGIPPTVGFYAKLAVLQALVSTNVAGYIWLAVVAVVLSLLGAFYYLRVVKVMYFDEPVDAHPLGGTQRRAHLLSLNGAAVLLLGMLPGGLMQLCAQAIVADVRDMKTPPRARSRRHAARSTPTRRTCARRRSSRSRSGAAPSSTCASDRVGLPDGSSAHREYIVHPGAVMVVPLLDDGRLVVERQCRYPMEKAMLEFPAGKLDARRAGARLRRARACRGDRLPRRRVGARRRPAQRDRLLRRGHRGLVRTGPRARRASARRRRVPRRVRGDARRAGSGGAGRRAHRCQDADRPALAAELARRPLAVEWQPRATPDAPCR